MAEKNRRSSASWQKGQSGNPSGRPPGIPNKTTANVKAALEMAFDKIGGVDRLAQWAEDNPTEFFKLYSKLLPVHLQGEVKISGTLAERLQRAIEAK